MCAAFPTRCFWTSIEPSGRSKPYSPHRLRWHLNPRSSLVVLRRKERNNASPQMQSRAFGVVLGAFRNLTRRGAGQTLEPDTGAAAAAVQSATADSGAVSERHGHLPSGGP